MSPPSIRPALWLVMSVLAVVCVSACGERRTLEGDVWGDDPGRPARLNGGARLDAGSGAPSGNGRDASSRDGGGGASEGGSGGSGGAGQSDAGVLVGTDAGVLGACEQCEAQVCRSQGGYLNMGDIAPMCYPDAACKAVLDCVRRTKCLEPPDDHDGLKCYCGTARGVSCLASGAPNGPCREEIEVAADSTNPADVVGRFNDLVYPLGKAVQLSICRAYYCSTPCFDFPGKNCLIDFMDGVFGNPLCETEKCRKEGQCVPRSQCVEWGDCLPDVDGGAPSPDGGSDASSPDVPHSEVLPAPEAGVAADAPSVGPADAAVHTAWSSAECVACVNTTIQSGEVDSCRPESGCDKMPADATEEDRQLCRVALSCMQATGCWLDGPLKCLCGTAEDTACFSAANGACRDQIRAATKAADWSEAGVRFLDTMYPSGYAALLVSCYFDDSCKAACSVPVVPGVDAGTAASLSSGSYLNFTTRSCEESIQTRHQCVAKTTQLESLDKVMGRGR